MTPVQQKTLAFLREYTAEHEYSPTYQEIADHLGFVSKSGVHRVVLGLERLGRITRLPQGKRTIEVRAALTDRDVLRTRVAAALVEAHGFNDGDETMICCTPDELRATLARVL